MQTRVNEDLKLKIASELAVHETSTPFGMLDLLARESVSAAIEMRITDAEIVVTTALAVYDERIAVIDIPQIPNFIEPAFDVWVRKGLEAGIRFLFSKFGRKAPAAQA